MIHVQISEVESQHVQFPPVDNHHLSVVASQIVGGAGYSDALGEQPHFQFPQILFPATIRVRDQGVNEYTAAGRVHQSFLNLASIEAKNEYFYTFFGFINGLDQR
jgi:hypothetical protein